MIGRGSRATFGSIRRHDANRDPSNSDARWSLRDTSGSSVDDETPMCESRRPVPGIAVCLDVILPHVKFDGNRADYNRVCSCGRWRRVHTGAELFDLSPSGSLEGVAEVVVEFDVDLVEQVHCAG